MKSKTKRRIKVLVIAVLLLIMAFCTISIFHAYKFTHPKRYFGGYGPKSMELPYLERVKVTFTGVGPDRTYSSILPSEYGLPYENVSFQSKDGLTIRGWLVKAQNPKGTVIIAHGWDSNKGGMLNYSKFLYRNKYNTLLFDFRGNGESDGNYTSLGYYETLDVLGAVDYLKSRQDTKISKIGAIGFSMGGTALVMAAKRTSELNALVLDSVYPAIHQNVARRFKKVYGFPKFPFATSLTFFGGLMLGFNGFDLAPGKHIAGIKIPILIIQGSEDEQVTIDDAERIYKSANNPKFMWVVEGAGHADSYNVNSTAYERKVVSFFDENIQ